MRIRISPEAVKVKEMALAAKWGTDQVSATYRIFTRWLLLTGEVFFTAMSMDPLGNTPAADHKVPAVFYFIDTVFQKKIVVYILFM